MYLIRFQYEHYCQGFEWVTETVLVKVPEILGGYNLPNNTMDYCKKVISEKYLNAKDFENLTLE